MAAVVGDVMGEGKMRWFLSWGMVELVVLLVTEEGAPVEGGMVEVVVVGTGG